MRTPEEIEAYQKAYKLANSGRLKQKNHQYYQAHKKEIGAKSKQYYLEHKADINAWNRTYRKEYRENVRRKLREILNQSACQRCGSADNLEFDHINGGGQVDYKIHGSPTGMYHYYINHPVEARRTLQVLCEKCNALKQKERKEFDYRRSYRWYSDNMPTIAGDQEVNHMS